MNSLEDTRYGGEWWPVLSANWQDWRAGRRPVALARKGYLRQPHGEGKVVWIKAGRSADSVRLACELLGALRERRLDIRLALTFEHDHADIIKPRVKGLRNIGLGYGPSDRPRTVKRVMTRLKPFGLILVDTVPHPNLLHAVQAAHTHVIAFNTRPTPVVVEAAYPVDMRQAQAWHSSGMSSNILEPADPLALFVETQIDTTLRSLVVGGHDERHLWWWHDDVADTHEALVAHWRTSSLARYGILFISGTPENIDHIPADLSISAWNREPLLPGSIVRIDDPQWFAAISSAATAAYLHTQERMTFWQALAGGCAITPGITTRRFFPELQLSDMVADQVPAVCALWQKLQADPRSARNLGDRGRRYLWQERRRVQTILKAFLDRVFDW